MDPGLVDEGTNGDAPFKSSSRPKKGWTAGHYTWGAELALLDDPIPNLKVTHHR
jgi:hypothetical protein